MNPPTSPPRFRRPRPVAGHRLRRLAATAALTLAAAGLVAVPTGPAQADPDCLQVSYETTRVWRETIGGPTGDAGGFLTVVRLTNVCAQPVTGWRLVVELPAGQSLQFGWSAVFSQSGQVLTATNQAWNATIAPGQTVQFGFLGRWTGAYADPLSCTINGSPCDGSTEPNEPPVVALTAPTDGQGLNSVCPVFLTAEASDPDGSVDRVEFHVDGVLVGSDTTAPYAFEAETGVSSAFEHTAFARAVDDDGASTDSATIDFLRLPPPPSLQLVACNPPGEVAAGTSEEIHYAKTAAGTVPVTLTVTGDPGISVSPTSFTLTTGFHVVVSAAPGSSGSAATITATAPGFNSSTVTVTVP